MTRTRSLLTLFIVPLGTLVLLGITALIMAGQVQDDIELPRIAPTVAPGLKPEHHGELNRTTTSATRYDELRTEYEGDSVAQQQIDVYDPATVEYHNRVKEIVEATKSGDWERVTELESWFKEHYPDIH